MSASAHDQQLEEFQQQESDHDDESEGGDERPPAVVRNAIRRSTTPASPGTEDGSHATVTLDHGARAQLAANSPPILEEQVGSSEAHARMEPSAAPDAGNLNGALDHGGFTSAPQVEDFAFGVPSQTVGASAPPPELLIARRAGDGSDGQPTNHER